MIVDCFLNMDQVLFATTHIVSFICPPMLSLNFLGLSVLSRRQLPDIIIIVPERF